MGDEVRRRIEADAERFRDEAAGLDDEGFAGRALDAIGAAAAVDPDYALFRSLDGKTWRQLRECTYLALRALYGVSAPDEAPQLVSDLTRDIQKVLDEGPQNPWSRSA